MHPRTACTVGSVDDLCPLPTARLMTELGECDPARQCTPTPQSVAGVLQSQLVQGDRFVLIQRVQLKDQGQPSRCRSQLVVVGGRPSCCGDRGTAAALVAVPRHFLGYGPSYEPAAAYAGSGFQQTGSMWSITVPLLLMVGKATGNRQGTGSAQGRRQT